MTALRDAVAAVLDTAATQPNSFNRRVTKHMARTGMCALALTIGLGSIAEAQEATSLEEITVTGSRIRRTTDFETPNPTTVVDAAFLENLGIVNVGEALTQMPANISTFSPTTTGNGNFFAGSTIANLRGLNPFFGSRTLNLVNNRRFVPTNQGDGVDLNFIPSILIERMDVVTGGASAAYGSGAISGVNNVFLNRRLEGVKANLDYYQTSESDGDDAHAALAAGTSLFGGRGHIVFGYEFQDMDPVGCIEARDWCAEGIGFIPNSAAAPAPEQILARNVRANQISYAGVFQNFAPGALPTYQSNADGTGVMPFAVGEGANTIPFNNVVGGDGRSVYEYTNLRAPVERDVATAVFTLAMTDSVNMSVDLSWGNVETVNRTGALDANFIAVAPDNAYLLANPALAAANVFGLYNKDWTSQVDSFSRFTTEVQRGALAFDGRFGESSWTWDAYYQYGKTEREQLVNDNRHLNAYLMAVDAVDDGSGNIVCRVTRDGFAGAVAGNPGGGYGTADPRIADDCVPLSPFGTQAIPADAYAYAFGYLRENLDYQQQVLAANFTGDLFAGFGAGPIQAAFGVEYRMEEGENTAAEEQDSWDRTDYLIQYGESFAGDVDVTEGFLELNFPLLRDKPGAQLLELNGAVRQSRYDNQGKAGTTGESRSHDLTTWKISGMWDPVDWLRIRGSVSRDSRAANFRELYYGQKIQAGGVFGFCEQPTNSQPRDPCNWSLEGNVDLKPEESDTQTFGIVLTPEEWAPGLQFAADYFKIEIDGAIQQANITATLNGCRLSGIAELCALLTPEVPGDYSRLTDVRALASNGSSYSYEGVDISTSYLLQLNDTSNLNFRLLATHMMEQLFQPVPGQPFRDIVGQTGTSNSFLSDNQPAAEWLANLSATYNRGPLSVTANVRYIDEGILNYLGVTPEDANYIAPPPPAPSDGLTRMDRNTVPSYAVWTLSGSYSFDDVGPMSSLQLFAVVDNLFDKEPPIAAGTGFGGNANGGTNAVFYDTMGRAFRLGARMSF